MIRVEDDGRWDLRQVYFYDTELDMFAEPEVLGELPAVSQ